MFFGKKISFRGFTLIEVLVVTSIIGVLSGIVLAALSNSRARARDAKAIAELRSINIALQLYYDKYNTYPGNQGQGGGFCDCGVTTWLPAYTSLMQTLVDEKFLSQIPRGPSNGSCPIGNTSVGAYCYYNYGSGDPRGAVIKTTLEVAPQTTTGNPPSCRFSGQGWCDSNTLNREYCLCNPH